MLFVNIDIQVTGSFKDGLEALKDLRKVSSSAIGIGCGTVAESAATALKHNIVSGKINRRPLTELSQAKRDLGKTKGASGPAIRAWGGSQPLSRSGKYANAIFAKRTTKLSWMVTINNQKGFYSGGNRSNVLHVAEYAKNLEFGFSKAIPATIRMIAYIKILAGVLHGPFKKRAPDKPANYVVKITVPPRPIWRLTWEEYKRGNKAFNLFIRTWAKRVGNTQLKNLVSP